MDGPDVENGAASDSSDQEPVASSPPASQRQQLALRVHLRLATCRNLLMRASRLSANRWGLTLPQFDVLAELARSSSQGFTFVELSRLLLVTSGNLTGIVDRLEAEQYVRREGDAKDRRVTRIRLTEKGRALTEEMLPRHANEVQEALSSMSRDSLLQLNKLLGELRAGLNERLASGRPGTKRTPPEPRDQRASLKGRAEHRGGRDSLPGGGAGR